MAVTNKFKGRDKWEMYVRGDGTSADEDALIDGVTDVFASDSFSREQRDKVASCWSIAAHCTFITYTGSPVGIAHLEYVRAGSSNWVKIPGSSKPFPAAAGSVLVETIVEGNLPSDVDKIRVAFSESTTLDASNKLNVDASETILILRLL